MAGPPSTGEYPLSEGVKSTAEGKGAHSPIGASSSNAKSPGLPGRRPQFAVDCCSACIGDRPGGTVMLWVLRYTVWLLARLTLALRYRVRVHGLEQLRDLKGPILILPNHPGMIDPPLVL